MYQVDQGAYWQSQTIYWGPKILIAIAILIATWIVARLAKWAIQKAIDKTPALRKHVTGTPEETVGYQLGVIAKLIIWLVGIMAALTFLGVGQILTPINRMVVEIFDFLPRLLGAGLLFFVGLIIARIASRLVKTILIAANVDSFLKRIGLDAGDAPRPASAATTPEATRASLAQAIGVLVFALIIIPVSIAALQVLGISAISDPATAMLSTIAMAIPQVLAAVVIIAFAFVIGRWVKTLIEQILPGLGFDNSVRALGILPAAMPASRLLGSIAMIAVLIVGLMEAANRVGGASTAALLLQITELGGKVIFGTLIIVAGMFLARIVASLVGSGTGEGGYAQTIVRYAIIALFTAIGLTFMGLADQIVMMAFGLILGSAAVATALAFGLGGRDAAARQLEQWQREHGSTPPPPRAPRPARSVGDDDSQPPLV